MAKRDWPDKWRNRGRREVARGARADALRDSGMRVRGLAEFQLATRVVDDPSTLDEMDLLVLGVKTYHMEEALAAIKHCRPSGVFSVANGVLKNEQLAGVFGPERVLGCMADTSGELHEDGVVEFTRNISLNLGSYVAGSTNSPAKNVASEIHASGLVSRAVDDIASVEWSKFVPWIAMFVLSIIARRNTGLCLSDPMLARVGGRIVREAGDVAQAMSVALSNDAPMPIVDIRSAVSEDEAVEKVREVGRIFSENAPTHRMSSLQDLDGGRRLEVEGTLGYLVTKARELGVATPTLDLNYQLISGIDALQA